MIADDLARIPMSPFLSATLKRAAAYAAAQAHTEVSVEHLLLALTEDPEATVVLKSSNVDLQSLKNEVSDFVGRIEDRHPDGSGGAVSISHELRRILEAAAAAAQQSRRREINGAIVLAAIVGDGKSGAAHLLRSQGMTFEEAIRALQQAAAKPSPPQPSADDVLATARQRVQQTRTLGGPATRQPEPQPEPAPPHQPPGKPFRGAPPPGVYADEEELAGHQPDEPASAPQEELSHVDAFEEALAEPPRRNDGNQAHDTPDSPLGPDAEPHFGAPIPDQDASAPSPMDQLEAEGAAPPSPAPQAGPPPPPQQRHGSQSWAPPRAGGHQAQPRPGGPNGPGRVPPPIPPSPGPLQVPGQIRAPHGQAGGPPAPGQRPPQPSGMPRGAPKQSRVPWPETIDPPAPSARRAPEGGRRKGPRTVVSSGKLVHNIPNSMQVGISLVCEARIGRAEVKAIVEGLQGNAVVRQEIMVTKAMSVRLRSPDGGFFIEGSSPETQWIENVLGLPAEDYARWRWTITPRERGRKRLQLVVSARTVGSDGLAAETAMPDQVIEVKVRTNYARTTKRWIGWAMAAVVGGVFAHFGETLMLAAKGVYAMIMGG